MKFALIEDRLSRLEHFIDFDLKSFQSVSLITGNDFDYLIYDMECKRTERLDQFFCIASHRSALSNQSRDTLKEYCKINNKPLIFFSGGITFSVYKDVDFPFLHMNSRDFYSTNLKLFIEDYEKNRKSNLLVLQFGERWKLSLLLNLRNKIAVSLNLLAIKKQNLQYEIDETNIIKRVNDLQISSLIISDLINDRTKSILTGGNYSRITAEDLEELKKAVNDLINKEL